MTQRSSVFPARGDWSGRLELIAGGTTSLGEGHSKLKPWTAQKFEVMAEDSGQTSCRVTDQEQTNHYTPYPTRPCRRTYGGMVLVTWNTRQ